MAGLGLSGAGLRTPGREKRSVVEELASRSPLHCVAAKDEPAALNYAPSWARDRLLLDINGTTRQTLK